MSLPKQSLSDRTRLPILQSLRQRARPDGFSPDGDQSVKLPAGVSVPPFRQVLRRLAMALLVLAATTVIVWVDRAGYQDNTGSDGVDLLDSAYYATVTLSTTGYGDITPVSDSARLTNVLVITPLRVLFLIILVGTTLEVLTERTRREVRVRHWRTRIREHVVVVGYGTKGRYAVETLLGQGTPKERIVVVDPQPKAVEAAGSDGLVAVLGDATRADTLRKAELQRASQVIVAPPRDDTAALVTLTARQLNKRAAIVAAVREDENAPLLKQSGANTVVTSSSSAGRLLGVSVASPNTAVTLENLMTYGRGLDLVERRITQAEVGRSPHESEDLVVGVVRGRVFLDYRAPEVDPLQAGDRLITIQRSAKEHAPEG
ncbi:potassium channel family protein [Streptomyces sp. RY43-2]|uniref:Potassium channel family protein n=1 Tax=Streptomyces macrolidinus TaxID=2952607 RepID=A0ABT0ZEX1_9ACTN|nr:potassium channel family protein [Streptomyces macrolidinus]MCN9242112.1 potassium channel family protein [Streptomyces macrolidinus]